MLTGTTTPGDGPRRSAAHPAAKTGAPTDAERELPAFAEQFASSPRGVRLARRLTVRRMQEWGYLSVSDTSCAVALVVGELAANAVQHGRVPGHGFGLRIALDAAAGLVRVEVADAASAKWPPKAPPLSYPEGESGRGLLLVDVLAVRWGSAPRRPVGKTVWAEVSIETAGRAAGGKSGGPPLAGAGDQPTSEASSRYSPL
ncbi:ATP-binding protein [Streptomyces sp. VNUA24]|uniref:ATP-binding protein n=1 Tax=Streptomyces sp. VNUA24 TaxID=3031131 RepID=UPI0023B78D2B|nr:ATP-binding protein [Streptomyces sp. VNUA24]WEH17342.1 ATP-binding protein [Streptomyces sp. VNUA24]